MHPTKRPVDFDISIVSIRRKTDQLVGTKQTAEAALIGTTRWQVLAFIDEQTRQIPSILQQLLKSFEHLFVRQPKRPRVDDGLGGIKNRSVDNGLESPVGSN